MKKMTSDTMRKVNGGWGYKKTCPNCGAYTTRSTFCYLLHYWHCVMGR